LGDDGKIARLATMKKIFTSRITALMIGLFTILVLTVVTAGLDALEFKQAVPFRVESEVGGETINVGRWEFPLEKVFFYSFAFLIVLSIVALIFMPPKLRRRVLLLLAVLGAGLLLYGYMTNFGRRIEPLRTPEDQPSFGVLPEELYTPEPTVIPAEFTSPPVASWISYAVALAVTLALALVAWFLLIRRRQQPLPTMEEIAQSAVDDLQAGRDWGRTVEGAYLRMVDTVYRQRELKRSAHITPAEFAVILETTGLPVSAVRRLTALFERVRYGGKRSTQKDIEEAVACLTEIADACQEHHL
jgi:hypothetical protein